MRKVVNKDLYNKESRIILVLHSKMSQIYNVKRLNEDDFLFQIQDNLLNV